MQYETIDHEFVATFLHSICVDDEVFGVSSVQATYEVYYKVKTRLSEGDSTYVILSLILRN